MPALDAANKAVGTREGEIFFEEVGKDITESSLMAVGITGKTSEAKRACRKAGLDTHALLATVCSYRKEDRKKSIVII